MAVYAIGDVHGQYDALRRLLDRIQYSSRDQLWFVGDLVNRGPKSLDVLRFVYELGDSAKLVLGNHDFSLLVQAQRFKDIKVKKTAQELLDSEDALTLLNFLRHTPMLHIDEELGVAMAHAGWYPKWSLEEARRANALVCNALQEEDYRHFLYKVYGDSPRCYRAARNGKKLDRARFAVNAFCRMRYLDRDGCMNFSAKMPPEAAPKSLSPWFGVPTVLPYRLVFGHWASLGLQIGKQFACIDAGAAWGGSLIALDIANWRVAGRVSV